MAKATRRDNNPGEADAGAGVLDGSRNGEAQASAAAKRVRVSQSDVPAHALDDALRIPKAIADNYAYNPTTPLDVATALKMQPTASTFRMLTGASIAYGLTDGGYNAGAIVIQPLGRRILQATDENESAQARLEAIMRPRVIREFLNKYDGNRLPREEIALNVLRGLGVAPEAAQRTFAMIMANIKDLGVIRDISGVKYLQLSGAAQQRTVPADVGAQELDADDIYEVDIAKEELKPTPPAGIQPPHTQPANRRVFLTHGKNRGLIDSLKDLLVFGELEPVIAVEHETVSQPIPDKVMNDMRSCTAAIIHVDADEIVMTKDGEQRPILNENVLIEIGASMALYGRRFILLVKHGIRLPSNLQGLYEVRYDGEKLDGEATLRLLKAMKDIKNHPVPSH